jgi:hypothetical protein
MSRIGYPLIRLLGVEGKKVDIIPRTDEGIKGISCLTEIWNKKEEFLGYLAYDKRVKWKKFVLIELDKEMQMSQECINEAFELTKNYWKKKEKN